MKFSSWKCVRMIVMNILSGDTRSWIQYLPCLDGSLLCTQSVLNLLVCEAAISPWYRLSITWPSLAVIAEAPCWAIVIAVPKGCSQWMCVTSRLGWAQVWCRGLGPVGVLLPAVVGCGLVWCWHETQRSDASTSGPTWPVRPTCLGTGPCLVPVTG